MTPSLSETFEPPSTTTYGRSGSSVSRAAPRPRPTTSPPAACGSRCGDVVDAGVLAVHGAEAVVDVDVGRARPAASANAPRSASSLLVSPGVEAEVLQQRDARRRRAPSTAACGRLADGVGGEARPARRAARRAARRPGARQYFGSGAPLGRPRWAHDDDPRARVDAARRWSAATARIRPSSVIRSCLSSGTFRSARTSTRSTRRRPRPSRSSRVFTLRATVPTSLTRSTRRLE